MKIFLGSDHAKQLGHCCWSPIIGGKVVGRDIFASYLIDNGKEERAHSTPKMRIFSERSGNNLAQKARIFGLDVISNVIASRDDLQANQKMLVRWKGFHR